MSIQDEAKALQPQLIQWRRHVHENPEVGLETPDTEAFLAGELKKLGLEVTTGVGGHGVVGLLRGGQPGKTLAIRADIDALLVNEETGLPFASRRPGKMHACGHDAHTAIALGAAALLVRRKNRLAGNVKFIFQPAEEGPGGAKPMIDAGVLDNPTVDGIIGLHTGNIWKDALPGEVRVSHGRMLACMDSFDLRIVGKGGHGALPHLTVDPISIACHAVCAIQTIVSREINPCEPAVVTVGKIASGTAYNIIPGEVVIKGTVRAFKQETRDFLNHRIEAIVKGVTESMRGQYEYNYIYGYPPTINNAAFTDHFVKVAGAVIGADRIQEISEPVMGGEDMAYFLQKVPGTYFYLAGCNVDKGQTYSHHHSKFDIDEEILWEGSALMTAFAEDYLA